MSDNAPPEPHGVFARFARTTPPWLFAGLLTLIVVAGEELFDTLGGYERLALALGVSLVAEWVFSWLFAGRRGNTISAYITGNSVVVLTKPAAGLLWPFMLGPLIAIASKFALRYRGQHLWNPTNLSFSVLLLVAPGSVALLSHQWGNQLWVSAVLISLGFFIAGKARLLHISLSYALAFVVLAGFRAWLLDVPFRGELAPITGPVGILFTFFMLTDPKTVVKARGDRVRVVLIIALVECAIRLADEVHWPILRPLLAAPPIFALAIVGPLAKIWDLRRRTRVAA
ncbi:MAG: hypothetical protein DHS20C15_11360 [Planctomycetota bacterium]|nr:MAG: hypothetical protein DHS20C15_11360 [Planctomycetota bacterium]